MFSNFFFLKVVMLWNNVDSYGRAWQVQMIAQRFAEKMHFACRLTKERIQARTLTTSSRQRWFRERAAVLRYTCIACLVNKYCHNHRRYISNSVSSENKKAVIWPAVLWVVLWVFSECYSVACLPVHWKLLNAQEHWASHAPSISLMKADTNIMITPHTA